LDAPGIAAFAVAVHHAVNQQAASAERLRALRERMIRGVNASVPSAVLHGDPGNRLPGNAHFSFPGCEGDALLMLLDAAGVDVSTGSACSAGIPEPSHVLLALGVDEPTDVSDLWREDLVSFVLGCSYSFEEALIEDGLKIKHIEQNLRVPMYRPKPMAQPSLAWMCVCRICCLPVWFKCLK
jgi:hypothetical protein